MPTWFWILLVVVVLFGGGGWGYYRRDNGWVGWSPLGIIIVILVVLFLTGRIHL